MKLSLKLQEDQNPLLKAKIPISIFSQPFISSLTTTTPTAVTHGSNKSSQNTSFSVSTNFPSGPSLKLSYAPTTSPTSTIPFSLSLKSGLGLFGSPKDSPLIFSAQFSLSSTNPGIVIPTFSLHLKPQFGNFSLHKATLSNPNLEPDSRFHSISGTHFQPASPSNSEFGNGFSADGSSVWQEVKLEPPKGGGGDDGLCYGKGLYSNDAFGTESSLARKDDKKAGILGGIAVRARTFFPVTKRAMLNMRWAVNFPSDVGSKMPYLTVNKIGIERIEEVKEMKNKNTGGNEEDSELLKGMYFGMKRDLEMLENENRKMKQCLEDMRLGVSARNVRRESEGLGRRVSTPSVESSNDYERWRSKKTVAQDNGEKEVKKSANKMSDVESELQKAIKAASSS